MAARLTDRILPETQSGMDSTSSKTGMVFTLRQLQENLSEHRKPLFIAFVYLGWKYLYKVLKKICCPSIHLQLVISFNEGMNARIQFEWNASELLKMRSGMEYVCFLAPTLFDIYFVSVMLLMGARMKFTLKLGSMDLFSI